MWAVPKSLIIYDDTKDWIDTSLEARGIKLKITKIDIPVSYSSAFEGEIIRKGDMQIEVDGSRKDCFELVVTKDASEVEDHKIIVEGPELDELECGSKISLSYTVEVAGKNMQPDFEPVFERKIHQFLNCVEGRHAHRPARHDPRPRISKADFEAGFRFRHIGEVLYAKIKSEFDTVVDKCQVKIVVGDEAERCAAQARERDLRQARRASEVHDRRVRARVLLLHHVPGVLPEPRLHRHPGASRPLRRRVLAGRKGHQRARPAGPLPGRHQGTLHRRAYRPVRRRR